MYEFYVEKNCKTLLKDFKVYINGKTRCSWIGIQNFIKMSIFSNSLTNLVKLPFVGSDQVEYTVYKDEQKAANRQATPEEREPGRGFTLPASRTYCKGI